MIDPILQTYLFAFMLIATWLIIFWKYFRKIMGNTQTLYTERVLSYNRMKRISYYFRIIFFLFIVMILVYTVLPDFYYLFMPIERLDHPIINFTGLLILKIAIVWIVFAQIHIDKELYKYSRNIESLSTMELIRYSEKMLSIGILLLFIGFCTTITNIFGLLLVTISFFNYHKTFSSRILK